MSELSAILFALGGGLLLVLIVIAFVELSIWLEYDKGVDVEKIFVITLATLGCGLLITAFLVR